MTTDQSSSPSSGGIGFVGLLTILFVGLKLTEYIDWEWIWVLSPVWVSAAIVVTIFLIIVATIFIAHLFGWRE